MTSPNASVLVVDDQSDNYKIISKLLEDVASTVAWVADGKSALEFISQNHVDLVLMDGHMPGMNGVVATEKLLLLKPSLKIIAVTADPGFRIPMFRAGCVDFLVKPLRLVPLLESISRALGRAV